MSKSKKLKRRRKNNLLVSHAETQRKRGKLDLFVNEKRGNWPRFSFVGFVTFGNQSFMQRADKP